MKREEELNYKNDRKNNIFLSLDKICLSEESKGLSEYLSTEITKAGIKGNKNKRLNALCVICVGSMEAAAKGKEAYAIQRIAACDFTGKPVGYRPFTGTLESLKTLGYIDFQAGYCPPLKKDWAKARASRFRATAKLLALAAKHGITPENWEEHYATRSWSGVVDDPVILRSESRWTGLGWKKTKQPGSDMRFDPADPIVAPIIQQVIDLNTFFAGHDIQPAKLFRGLQRIFCKGDDPAFEWNKAGRLYAVEGGYQQEESDKRALMTINGEPVVEIDLKASHLTILYALNSQLVEGDPYDIPGVDRGVVKMLVTATLGRGKLPHKWPDDHKQQYMEENSGRRLQTDYPIGKTKKKVAERIPLLAAMEKSPWSWADLQYVESQAIIGAVRELAMVHGIPALPVHDSLIVPKSHQAKAEQVLCDVFRKYVGITPVLTVK